MNFREIVSYLHIESVIPEIACLSFDLVCLGIFYRLYHKKAKSIQTVKDAPEYEIDVKLYQKLQKAENRAVPYAVVRGVVHGTHQPIPSLHVPGFAGVIQQATILEHRVQWSPISRWWTDSRHEIQHSLREVPFYLSNYATRNKIKVNVQEPFTADGLELTIVYDQFIPKSDTIGGYLIGWVRGEHSKGFQITEKLLTEGTVLTGIGELVLENKDVHLRPSQHFEYYLTNLTKEGLIKKLEKDVNFYKVFTVTFGIFGLYILFLMGRSMYYEHKRKMNSDAEAKKREEIKKQRKRNARSIGQMEHNATPMCVVCLNNPVEVMVMECGHVCLCTDCADQVRSCPICRSSIAQTVAAFLP